MLSLHWDGTTARVIDSPPPVRTPQTAIVQMRLAGICNTDLEITRGYMSFRGVLGHELVGDVIDGPLNWLGKRVTAEINFACGDCSFCARGLSRHCGKRQVLGIHGADGALAELVRVPISNLHVVPSDVADDEAVFTEPLAAAFEILEQVHVRPEMSCVVIGDGKLGLLVAQVLHGQGARVLAVGKHRNHLAILERRGIATAIADEWACGEADLVVEASGSPQGFEKAVRATRPRGVLVLKSTFAGVVPVDLAPLVVQEITVIGSRCGNFAPALRALATRSVDVRSLIEARVPLDQAASGLALAARRGALKVLVEGQSA